MNNELKYSCDIKDCPHWDIMHSHAPESERPRVEDLIKLLSDADRVKADQDLLLYGNAFVRFQLDVSTGKKTAERIPPTGVTLK